MYPNNVHLCQYVRSSCSACVYVPTSKERRLSLNNIISSRIWGRVETVGYRGSHVIRCHGAFEKAALTRRAESIWSRERGAECAAIGHALTRDPLFVPASC